MISRRLRDAWPGLPDTDLEQMAGWSLAGELDPMTVPDPWPDAPTWMFLHPLGHVILDNACRHEELARPGDGIHGFLLRLLFEICDAFSAEFGVAR